MIVNVCPAAVTRTPPDKIWEILEATDRLGEWTDVKVVSMDPPGPAQAGQVVVMGSPALGRRWSLSIEVTGLDPQHRWIDYVVRLPFGISNYEHLTLTERPDGGTLVRFN